MGFGFVFIVGAILAVVFVIHRLTVQAAKQRTEAIRCVASELGVTFKESDDGLMPTRLDSFELMDKGHSKEVRNVLNAETDNLSLSIFDYKYVTGSGKHRSSHAHTVLLLRSRSLQMPKFHARPENSFLDGIAGALGFQDIDFDEHPRFSKTFVLKAKQEAETRAFFDVSLLEHFAAFPDAHFEGNGHQFLWYRATKRKPDEFRALLEEGFACFQVLRARCAAGHAEEM